jgi:hypothetical protein
MSHFTVLVVGDNPEDQLIPFDENLRTEFEDKTEEYKKEYLTESSKEFYCESCASWGQELTKEMYNKLKNSKIGRVVIYDVPKLGVGSYYKTNKKYKGYYGLEGGKRCKGSQWFEVEEILETTHPDSDVCFEGKIRIRKIGVPKNIAIKDKYPLYKDYLKDWHGIEDDTEQGYHFNPKAKWDWYQLGGRWAGFFHLTPDGHGQRGEKSWCNENEPIKANTVDQAMKGDIDFEAMKQNNFEECTEIYNEFKEGYDKGEMTPADGYFRFGIENKGGKDNYVPETREEYLNRRVDFSTFAVLKDGEWYEKGEMGWWGCISDEKKPDEWTEQFNKLVDELPDDTLLSIYDCHI